MTVQKIYETWWQMIGGNENRVPSAQKREMKRCFFAGCAGMLNAVQNLGEEEISEEAGVLQLEMFKEELAQFGKDILAGKQ